MSDNDKLQLLKDKRDWLLAKREELISGIKAKYPGIKLEPEHLKEYSVKIGAALAIAVAAYSTVPALAQSPAEPPLPEAAEIKVEELYGLDEDAKGELVWECYGEVIKSVADRYQMDPKLIYATIMIESGGNARAYRAEPRIGDASYGLGQFLYGTACLLGYTGTPEGLYDPFTSINLVGKYHRRNQDTYGGNLTPEELTIAYNAGSPFSYPHPGHVAKFQKWFGKAKGIMS